MNFFKKILKRAKDRMAKISIDGVQYEGNMITIYNNKIIVDGIDRTPESLKVNIVVHGNLEALNADVANQIEVQGVARTVKTVSGDVTVNGNVGGCAQTVSGDINVEGDIMSSVTTTSGDVSARSIMGEAKSKSGDISIG